MIKTIKSTSKNIEITPQKDKSAEKGNDACRDWKKIEKWATEELLQNCLNGNSQTINQKSMEGNIVTILLNRVKQAKGSDCIENWNNNFHMIFPKWKESFFENNKEKTTPTDSFISVVEEDLLQRNLAIYRNGDHDSERIEVLLFYFRKRAGRNFLKQTTPSALCPNGWTWSTEEVNSIKEQLNIQFSACIKALENSLQTSIMEKHEKLQSSKNDTLWWLADACLQDFPKGENAYNILSKITYYCYNISQNDEGKKMQADQDLWETYQKYNPIAGNFVSIYAPNFSRCKLDDLEKNDSRNKRKRIKNKLKNKYEGEELNREIEKQLKNEAEISLYASISKDETDGETIGSLTPDDALTPEEKTAGFQMAVSMLRAFAETVISRKHLKNSNDDLFFTEVVSQIIRDDNNLAEDVHKSQNLYIDACNLNFLNFYLQQLVENIYDSRKCLLKKIQDFHPEEQKPEYNRDCGFPLENIVYKQFMHAKNDSNITGKRETFRKHFRACLIDQSLIEME